ncbi:MAG: glycosyl hydrolase 53 family protein, partial [Lachnospiraceae bacterium]|nr:glycosyl hydrolase 53 family protein [Lachnospiraceae bacterium]
MRFIKGMDVSMLKELESYGASYYLADQKEDLFAILKKCGTDMIRLRIWQDPYDDNGDAYGGGMNDLTTTIELAKRAVCNELSILLDFHYSDFWADPSKQIKPKSWKNLQGITP